MKAAIPSFWCGGIPRTIETLNTITASRILKIGDMYNERDQGELAIREYHEFVDRAVKLKKYPEKIRSSCSDKKCIYRCIIRCGYYDEENSTRLV